MADRQRLNQIELRIDIAWLSDAGNLYGPKSSQDLKHRPYALNGTSFCRSDRSLEVCLGKRIRYRGMQ